MRNIVVLVVGMFALLQALACREGGETLAPSSTQGVQSGSQKTRKFWDRFFAGDSSVRLALVKENFCEMRAKIPDFDLKYPGYDPVLGYAIAAGAYHEVVSKQNLRRCSKNPSNTETCYGCDASAGCYNCLYHVFKESGQARLLYKALSGDSGFYWNIAREGRMNECSWARSFADYFEPAAFNGQLQELGYGKMWFEHYARNLSHKSPAVLKDPAAMTALAAEAPPGAVVVWGVCGTRVRAGCNGMDGIGHIGITVTSHFNLSNYIGRLPDGPCDSSALLGIYIPTVAQGARSTIDCSEGAGGVPPSTEGEQQEQR